MNILHGIILGIVQGLGEFLPISSSGHLLLARYLMGIDDANNAYKVLDILMHIGTLLPVVIVFWKDWMAMLRHPIKNRTLLYLFIASLPTLVIYAAAKKLFPAVGGFAVFDSGWFLGAAFLITSLFLLLSDVVAKRMKAPKDQPGLLHVIVMGCFQGIGLIQGVSRSGSTIFGGLLSGLNRKTAAKFSFMMSAPAIVGSLLMEGKDAIEEGLFASLELLPTVVGIIAAAITGYLAIRWFLRIIEKVPMCWFALYTGVLGAAVLVLQVLGVPFVPAFVLP